MLALLRLKPWLEKQMKMALEKAARGSDPSLIAERIIDDVEDGVDPAMLIQFVAREDWFEFLQGFDARVVSYRPWFTQMRQAMLEQFSATSAPPMTVTPQPASGELDRPTGPPSLTGES